MSMNILIDTLETTVRLEKKDGCLVTSWGRIGPICLVRVEREDKALSHDNNYILGV